MSFFSACKYQEVSEGFSSVSRMMILCWVLKETEGRRHMPGPRDWCPGLWLRPRGRSQDSTAVTGREPGSLGVCGCSRLQVKGSEQMIWVSVSCGHVSQSPAHPVPTGGPVAPGSASLRPFPRGSPARQG